MIISSSGYYSTGSSAAFVLLKEYSSCTEGILKNWEFKSHDYENIILYSPDSIFDLEDKLLIGNSIHRSDEAIRRFYQNMKRLNDNCYIWCGDFQRLLGPEFMQEVNHYLKNIVSDVVPGHWEFHYGNDKFSFRKFLGSIKRTMQKRPILGDFCKWENFRFDNKLYYAFPEEEEFYYHTKNFLGSFIRLMYGKESQEKNLILNHFILPHNFYRIPRYFDEEEIRVLVVDRDPRDVFVMEKYRTRNDHSLLPCDNVEDFVRFWKRLRESEQKLDDRRIVRIKFEDMIYRYEETVSYIEKTCSLKKEDHLYPKKFFSPEKSSYNTQLFKLDNKWNDEIAYIEKELSDYLYAFPELEERSVMISKEQYGIYVC